MAEVPTKITQNPLNNIMALISKRLSLLKGKVPAVQKINQKESQPEDEIEIRPEDIKKEGIVSKSMQQFKGVVGKVTPPPSTEAKGKGTKSPTGKKGLPKPLLGIMVAVVLLLIISLLISKLVPAIRKDGKKDGGAAQPTPTPVGFIKYKPSVYAGDPKVLALEEEVNILDGEVRSIILKDDTLKPPTVDFNINFK